MEKERERWNGTTKTKIKVLISYTHTHTHTHTSIQGEVTSFPHDVSELSIEYQSALQREKELARRYEDLFSFLHVHVKDSQVSCHILTCITVIDRLSN